MGSTMHQPELMDLAPRLFPNHLVTLVYDVEYVFRHAAKGFRVLVLGTAKLGQAPARTAIAQAG